MNKQEMGKWLAENVLEWTRNDEKQMWDCPTNRIGEAGKELTGVWYSALERIIYSPDGLLAVVGQVRKLQPIPKVICLAWSAFLL